MQNLSRHGLALATAALLLVGAGCGSTVATNTNFGTDTGNTNAGVDVGVDANVGGGAADIRIAGNAIILGSQKPGTSFTVEEFQTDKPAFLVVHEGSAHGKIIGRSILVDGGGEQHVVVNLDRASVHGETLFLMGHVDDGDGSLDDGDKEHVKDWRGNDIVVEVEIDKDASEEPLLPRI